MATGADRELPLPPREMMATVGKGSTDDLELSHLLIGEALKSRVVELLGPDWSWEGRRALDFGCGSGRLLRQLVEEAGEAELFGSDISEEMVSWVQRHLCPPIAGAQVNGERPPLDFPDDHFDLVTALSVFTHIANGWSDWLLEMHRILKPGGTLIATFLDSSCAGMLAPVPWDEERVGMSCFGFANPDFEWPNVLLSPWWLREHWGRAFEILELSPGEDVPYDGGVVSHTHGWLSAHARDVELTPEDLERESADDPRYAAARRYQFELLRVEGEELRKRHEALVESASWRVTSPLRRARALLRRRG
jgi:ubiquinone/menaquinone biosynthesis C-methylase UbiE